MIIKGNPPQVVQAVYPQKKVNNKKEKKILQKRIFYLSKRVATFQICRFHLSLNKIRFK